MSRQLPEHFAAPSEARVVRLRPRTPRKPRPNPAACAQPRLSPLLSGDRRSLVRNHLTTSRPCGNSRRPPALPPVSAQFRERHGGIMPGEACIIAGNGGDGVSTARRLRYREPLRGRRNTDDPVGGNYGSANARPPAGCRHGVPPRRQKDYVEFLDKPNLTLSPFPGCVGESERHRPVSSDPHEVRLGRS